MLTPEISEMYPGTSGKTQGERKERIPAANEIPILNSVIPEPSMVDR
jgi:hypothetical protein